MRRGSKARRERRRRQHGLSLLALVAGVVGCGAVLTAAVLPGLAPSVDPNPSWGAAWSAGVRSADSLTAAAVTERLSLASGLAAFVAGLGVSTLLLLLVGGRERRRPGLAVRFSLGADVRRLVAHLVSRDRRRLTLLFVLGPVVGAAGAVTLRLTWPGTGLPLVETPAAVAGPLVGAAIGALILTAAVVAAGLLSPLPGLGKRAPDLLRRGHGITDDPRAGTVRRGVATLQGGLAFALALTGVALVRGTPPAPGVGGVDEEDQLHITRYAVADPDLFGGGGPLASGLLASPGVWTGTGARDLVTVECGACVRGVWYLPVYGVDSTVHAVQPAVLGALGVDPLEGRALTPDDTASADLVGVVNPAFRRHFEDGAPVGRRIRLSGAGDRWVRVVGVVSEPAFRGPGAPGPDDPVLWVPLAQHDAVQVEGVAPVPTPAGLRPLTEPRPLIEFRRAALAPVAWSGWVLFAGGALALGLALLSAAEVARVEVRGRARAAAVRIALGAPPVRPARAVLGRALRGAALGVVVGLAVAWALERALGVGGQLPFGVRPGLAGAVFLVTAAAALPRVLDLLRLDPAVLLREE